MEKVASKDVKDEGGVHLEGGDQGAMATAADGNGHAPDEQSVWTVVKANPKVIMYSLAMSSGPLLFGFDILTVGVVTGVPFFQITFGTPYGPQQYLIPSLWLGLWNAMLSFGGMVGSWLAGMALVRFGRKIPFVAAGLISIGGVLCLYYSDRGTTLNTRRSVFLVGKIILGFAMGVEIACTQTYISEIAPKRLRAPLLALFMVAIIAFLAELAFSGLTVIVGTTVPESPVYLLQTNQPEKALKAYSRLHNASDVSGGLAALSSSLEEEREITAAAAGDEAGGYLECFRHVNFRRTRIIIWCNIFQQFLGTPLLSNAPYFFQLVGMSSSLSLDLVEIGTGVNVAGTLLGAYILTKIGRRPLILFGTAFVAVLWLAIAMATPAL
ncbi:hypothetical protein SBRCBS47491_006590 [Sporothrix bragantina]|uniref:Major facilitator superfamily (MFS) profile domain-containing protein n=1 Tax=Sporothrix bragantina TaxID=671064 RepID=A0ABP0C663_9PEZI